MNTEITKITDINWVQGWLLYDGDCVRCRRFAAFIEPILTRRGFDLALLQSGWVAECLGEEIDFSQMRVITFAGESFGGADALMFLARRIWWAWPIYILGRLGLMPLLRRAYDWCAVRRHCHGTDRAKFGVPASAGADQRARPSRPDRTISNFTG